MENKGEVSDLESSKPLQNNQQKKRKKYFNESKNGKTKNCDSPCHKRKKDTMERFDETEYHFTGGMRHVHPYIYTYKTNAKGRWFGRKLLEVFTKEFGAHPPEYYVAAVKSGRIKVNGKSVDENYQIKNGDHIIHTIHRHEPPVSGQPIEVIADTDEYLVVNKPPSMPMHPCGAYRYNSLFHILNKEFPGGVKDYHICYRLDRLTSGLSILAKSSELKAKFSEHLAKQSHDKTYLARVLGDFPSCAPEAYKFNESSSVEEKDAQNHLGKDSKQSAPDKVCRWSEMHLDSGGGEKIIKVSCPVRCANHKQGVWEVHADGKSAETIFKKLSFNGKTSVVEATPITGRTHQIRLHLQWLGHPIANDPNYGGQLFYSDPEQRKEFEASKAWMKKNNALSEEKTTDNTPLSDHEVSSSQPQQEGESEEEFLKRTCRFCQQREEQIFNENQLHATKIWLHAFRYKGDSWAFETPFPEWALDTFPS